MSSYTTEYLKYWNTQKQMTNIIIKHNKELLKIINDSQQNQKDCEFQEIKFMYGDLREAKKLKQELTNNIEHQENQLSLINMQIGMVEAMHKDSLKPSKN